MSKNSKSTEDLLSLARDRMKMAISAYSDSREDELDDLKFYAGNPWSGAGADNQCPAMSDHQ